MKRIFRNFMVVTSSLLLIVALVGGVWLQGMFNTMTVQNNPTTTQLVTQVVGEDGQPTEMTVTTEVINMDAAQYYDWEFSEDYINVLCVGMDTRDIDSDYGLTDVMIIASLDLTSQRIRLVSLMRDMYVKPAGYSGGTKLNSVYAGYGGIEALMRTVNENFGTNISRYAIVNFYGLVDIIDRIGGVTIDVSDAEVKTINGMLWETYSNLGMSVPESSYLTHSGEQLLNGHQAVAFARIRKLGNGDFERTSRQREVMEAMLDKVLTLGILQWPAIFNDCKEFVRTNMSADEILAAGIKVLRFKNLELEQLRIPVDGSWNYQTINGLSYVVANMSDSKNAVQQFLAGNYVAPEDQ